MMEASLIVAISARDCTFLIRTKDLTVCSIQSNTGLSLLVAKAGDQDSPASRLEVGERTKMQAEHDAWRKLLVPKVRIYSIDAMHPITLSYTTRTI